MHNQILFLALSTLQSNTFVYIEIFSSTDAIDMKLHIRIELNKGKVHAQDS